MESYPRYDIYCRFFPPGFRVEGSLKLPDFSLNLENAGTTKVMLTYDWL